MRDTISFEDLAVGTAARPAGEDLNGAADAGQGILDLVRHDRRHLPELCQRRLLGQPRFHLHAVGQVVKDPGELPLATDRHLADRQVEGKGRAVLPPPLDLPAAADDLRAAGGDVAR